MYRVSTLTPNWLMSAPVYDGDEGQTRIIFRRASSILRQNSVPHTILVVTKDRDNPLDIPRFRQ